MWASVANAIMHAIIHVGTISQDGVKSEDKHYSPIIMISAGQWTNKLSNVSIQFL